MCSHAVAAAVHAYYKALVMPAMLAEKHADMQAQSYMHLNDSMYAQMNDSMHAQMLHAGERVQVL